MKFSELKSERLIIRPVRLNDKESIYNYRSDSKTNKYLSLIPQSIEDVAEFINRSSSIINIPGTWFQVVVIEQNSNELIGDIGLHFLTTDTENKQVEIGYTFHHNYQGKGYATEALKEIINYLINSLNKHRIIASIDPTNSASIKLIERLGFRKEAHFVEGISFQGKWMDDAIYAILAKEWKQLK